jgi:protocatechuate 4,5-dioxygenase beta chain
VAKIIASVNVSHVPAIGAAWDNGKTETPYWAPVFKGFEFSKQWIADLKPDVIILVYNDHASAFSLKSFRLSRSVVPKSSNRRMRVGGRVPCPS